MSAAAYARSPQKSSSQSPNGSNDNINSERSFGISALRKWLVAVALVWLVEWLVIPQTNAFVVNLAINSGIAIILAVSLNLVNGFTGQFSMGHAGFMSVGAYTSAVITLSVSNQGAEMPSALWFILSLILGGSLAAAAGYLVGLPSLRLKGDYLAIVTLGFGEIIRVVVLNIDAIGGARGLPNIPQMTNFAWTSTWVLITIFCISRLLYSSYGRSFMAVREDEIAAEAMGVHSTQAKVRAFIIGAFFAGVAGGLYGSYLRFLSPQPFDYNKSFEIIIMVVLGGMGSLTGSVITAILLTLLPEALRPLQQYTQVDFRMVIYSIVLILLMLKRPNGLMGTREFFDFLPHKIRRWFTHKECAT